MTFKKLSEIALINISGVDKKIKDNERLVSLCNFTDVYNNWAISKKNIKNFMVASANSKEIEKFALKKGYIAITKDSETKEDIGMSCYIADDLPNTLLGYHCALIIPNEKFINGKYLNTYLNSKTARLYFSNQASGSGQRYTLTLGGIGEVKVPIIPLEQQIKLGNIFSFIDRKICNNIEINTQLEALAKTIYDYWFLQFEFPNEEGKPYKSSGGKMVYNEQLKREIPEGWEIVNLMNNTFCYDIKAGVDCFNYKNYLPTSNINGENITDGEYITFEQRESRANMQPKKYSVWFAKMKNSVKHLSVPFNSEWFINKYILSTGFQGLQCNEKTFAYIHSIINSSWFENYKDLLSHGATQESINNEDLKNIFFVCPSDKVLEKFNKICLPILEKKFSIIRENQELSSLRDFLLPLLMNGQVTFKDENEEFWSWTII